MNRPMVLHNSVMNMHKKTLESKLYTKNGGLSDARNVGIAQAKGEYITFIDSDDAITKDTLQLLVAELQKYPQTDILEYPIMEK